MAYNNTQANTRNDILHGVLDAMKATFSALGGFFLSISKANHRMHHVERLQAKSDAELKEMGLRREDIARHVFNDSLYL